MIAPVFPSNPNPFGNDPAVIDQLVYGAVPPDACSVTPIYCTFTVPFGSVGAVVMVGPPMMFSENDFVVDPCALSLT